MSSQLVPGSKLTDTKISKDMVEEESNEILLFYSMVFIMLGKKELKIPKSLCFTSILLTK